MPKVSGSSSAEYTWPITGSLNGLARIDYSYAGKSASQFRPTYVYYETQGDFSNVNLRGGVEGEDWGAFLFVNNVFNEVGLATVTSSLNNKRSVTSLSPRTVGVTLRKRY